MNEFPNVKKNFGFGCMRLPMDGERVDYAEFTRMIDRFMAEGFNYFDTARVYIGGRAFFLALVAAVRRSCARGIDSRPVLCYTPKKAFWEARQWN